MRRSTTYITLSLALFSAAAFAAPVLAANEMEVSGKNLEAAMASGQAAAIHPGDEVLTCEQLQAEVTSTMSDPAMQAQLQASGAKAQAMQARAQQAQAGMKTQIAGNMALGVASSFVPGLGYVQAAAMQAQAMQQKKDGEAGQRDMASMIDGMTASMPQMMRGQHLYDLAQAKKCAFIEGPPASN